ncbi:MAG: GMC family oxidoreductase [Propionibacteriaceae bacterium]|nr:GMC family oxidoreductase [Propionibacteriaceae bacterium]
MTIKRGNYEATEWQSKPGDRADVLVIGGGASGATVSKFLAHEGLHVVCLEQGTWVNTAEYTGNRREYELSMFGRWHKNPNARGLPEDYPLEVSNCDIDPVMYNAVGGGSVHFGGMWPRIMPSDFRLKSTFGIGDDWPISWEELWPFYDLNDQDWGCAAMVGDPAFPIMGTPPMPAHPINDYGRRFAQGMNKLGWHWWPAPNAIANQNHHGLVPCVRYGTCESGCPNGSKASADITHWPYAIRDGATLVTRARVREITIDSQGLASGAIFLDVEGNEHQVEADVVVMAANGIGTARLLLMSTSNRFPQGLANSSGLVGRRLMLNPCPMVIGVYDEPLHSWMGPAGQNVHSFEFYETDESRGHALGGSWMTMPTGGPYAAAEILAQDGDDIHGPGLLDKVGEIMGYSQLVAMVTADLPHEDNRVELDSTLTDSSGLPAPRVTYKQDANSDALIDWHIDKVGEALYASGASRVINFPAMPDQPGHLLGTARMGNDPGTSVVDKYGRSHDVPNLYVVDGSVFVTSCAISPTGTITALALRTAHHLLQNAIDQLTPD